MVRLQQGSVRPGKSGFSEGVEYIWAQVAQASEDMVYLVQRQENGCQDMKYGAGRWNGSARLLERK